MRYEGSADFRILPGERQGKTIEVIGNNRSARNHSTAGRGGKKLTQRKRRAIIRRRRRIFCTVVLVMAAVFFANGKKLLPAMFEIGADRVQNFLRTVQREDYPQELLEMLEHNEETYDYVANYPNRDQYLAQEIDLSGVCQSGQAPLLMQWDMRWGYDSYGDSMVGVAGCGPTCMTMAYLCLTGDTSMNPRKMAEYAAQKGYHSEAGTAWSFFTEGAAGLGLSGRELPLSETAMRQAIDQGGVIVCSMRPGDFTTTGHFILLRGYDERGFLVNDPNSRKNSEKQWDFETLSGQIKCLWEITK